MNVTEVVALPHGIVDSVASVAAVVSTTHSPPAASHPPTITCLDSVSATADHPPTLTTTSSPLRPARKPAPGLAARLKALGFGHHDGDPRSPTASPGRIPEDHIRQIDRSHQLNSASTAVPRLGRTWNGLALPRQLPTAPSAPEPRSTMSTHDAADVDSHKYRMPEHTNGNGTKAMPDTRQAHLDRDLRPGDDRPLVPPKDSPDALVDSPSYFNPFGLQRAGSIYTLSRASFASQLAQLTSLQLPDAASLSSRVSAIPTAAAASKVLIGAADQIRSWISKAAEVLEGLDADDDIDWAAIGGREGLDEVDACIKHFEKLINVYIGAIEELQRREDIALVSTDDLTRTVTQMETILAEWEAIEKDMKRTKDSVEMALEYEELCNVVLGDIGDEMETLSRVVFEMEEKRHKSLILEASGDNMDIGELENIVDDTPAARNKRLSIPAALPVTPGSPGTPVMTQDDSSLLALFARMQPLRASLDFLPMTLSNFVTRAERVFPTACRELEQRRLGLEASWKQLETDAESLRRELGEDRWVLVFRGAGRQAQKMYESVERGMAKLQESMEQEAHIQNPAAFSKKVENYEAKKMHYGPAIERVLAIVARGVKDRLTVNGEIERLHADMHRKWESLKEEMRRLDMALEDLQSDRRNQQLRDSISSLVSNDRSTLGSLETPGSSPASSVVLSSFGDFTTPTSASKLRANRLSRLPQASAQRSVSMSDTHSARRAATNRLSLYSSPARGASPVASAHSNRSASRLDMSTPTKRVDHRPRWNSSTNTEGTIGHNFKPTTPADPIRTPRITREFSSPGSADSRLPVRSPLARDAASPVADRTPSRAAKTFLSFRERVASPGPGSSPQSSDALRPPAGLQKKLSTPALGNRRSSLQPPATSSASTRPASSLAASRRVSMLPHMRQESQDKSKDKPRWRH